MTLVRANDMGELATFVSYLLGYHPGRAMVLMGQIGTRIGPVLRIDLDPSPPGPIRVATGGPSLVGGMKALAEPSDRIFAIAFEEDAGESLRWDLALRALGEELGMRFEPTVRVRDGRWYWVDSPRGEDVVGAARETEGGLMPDSASLPAVAEFVLAGRAPLGARSDLVALVRHRSEQLGKVEGALHRLKAATCAAAAGMDPSDAKAPVPEWMDVRGSLRAWVRVLTGPAGRHDDPDPQPIAEAVWSLNDTQLRDAVITWVAPAYGIDPDDVPCHLQQPIEETFVPAQLGDPNEVTQRLIRLCQATPYEERAPALTILAIHSWAAGDGSLARVAVEEALLIEPSYGMAQHVESMIDGIVRCPPTVDSQAPAPGSGSHSPVTALPRTFPEPA